MLNNDEIWVYILTSLFSKGKSLCDWYLIALPTTCSLTALLIGGSKKWTSSILARLIPSFDSLSRIIIVYVKSLLKVFNNELLLSRDKDVFKYKCLIFFAFKYRLNKYAPCSK